MSEPLDLARVRHDNALRLFDEFVHANVRSADAATLRGLERRFAERLQIQPSYWSQIKARSRQIGERLARQFEQLCRKPAGWMDQPHDRPSVGAGQAESKVAAASALPVQPDGTRRAVGGAGAGPHPAAVPAGAAAVPPGAAASGDPSSQAQDDDERFIVGLVLTYYRRHPQRARARLLDLLGEVLTPQEPATAPPKAKTPPKPGTRPTAPGAQPDSQRTPQAPDDDLALWQRTQAGVAPLPRKR